MSKKITLLLIFLISTTLHAATATLEVRPSSTEIAESENLSIEFKVSIDDYNAQIGKPEYSAPDFDEVNIYNGMTGIESSFINGSVSVRRTQSVTVVLHPKRTGSHKITGISVIVNGKPVKSEDVRIEVGGAGSARNRGGGYAFNRPRSQLPGSGVHSPRGGSSFFLKTEPSKTKVYKGEQIILTYAIYTQVPILAYQVERYPTVPGFLKEDLEIPVLSGRPQYTRSVVGGREYDRAVLAQYAVFPVKEGALSIDSFTGKFSYRTNRMHNGTVDDDNDPMGLLNHFFNSMQAQTDTRSSDRVQVEVLPLPASGQPSSFGGLVGDFEITAVADKYTLKAGEALNVKVKVEGKGHAGSLERLNVEWPKDFELYEDKSSTQFLKTGRSERLFDFMLIPKVKGSYEIPSIELSMFNPETAKYVVRRTEPIKIEVLDGSGANVYIAKTKGAAPQVQEKQDIRYWKEDIGETGGEATLKLVRALVLGSLGFAAFGYIRLAIPEENAEKKKAKGRTGKAFTDRVNTLQRFDQTPTETLARAEQIMNEILQSKFGITKGSLRRAEVHEELSVKKVDPVVAKKIESFLERCENFRFVPGGAQPQAAREVVGELSQLIGRIYS